MTTTYIDDFLADLDTLPKATGWVSGGDYDPSDFKVVFRDELGYGTGVVLMSAETRLHIFGEALATTIDWQFHLLKCELNFRVWDARHALGLVDDQGDLDIPF